MLRLFLAASVAALAMSGCALGPPASCTQDPFPPAASDARPSGPAGRMLVLPGVYNTKTQLRGFTNRVEARLPGLEIEVRRWGSWMLPLRNLRAYERNRETAERIADEIEAWRREHPDELFYLVGYSGGGGVAALVAAELGPGAIDRLILVAPAISPDFPLERDVLPSVRGFVANFASARDLQVGWGTRTFGTIDRKHTSSAGAVGFDAEDPRLVQWRWRPADRDCGHTGRHWAYLRGAWQRAALLPSLDPGVDAERLAARWDARDADEPRAARE